MLQTIEYKKPERAKLRMPSRMAGPEGLLIAIILLAAKDALYKPAAHHDRLSALAYFQSEKYQHHLAWLGLDPEWLPVGIERVIN